VSQNKQGKEPTEAGANKLNSVYRRLFLVAPCSAELSLPPPASAGTLLGLLFYPEDEGDMYLRDVGLPSK
jgi:hypothetical protein